MATKMLANLAKPYWLCGAVYFCIWETPNDKPVFCTAQGLWVCTEQISFYWQTDLSWLATYPVMKCIDLETQFKKKLKIVWRCNNLITNWYQCHHSQIFEALSNFKDPEQLIQVCLISGIKQDSTGHSSCRTSSSLL